MHLTDIQIKELEEFFPDTYTQFIEDGDVDALLDALDDLYLSLLDEEYEPTVASRKCERLRDEIHWNHYH